MNCPVCDYKIESHFNFCPNCGANLKLNTTKMDGKYIPKHTIYSIIGGGILLAALILFLTGVFTTPDLSEFSQNAASQNQNNAQNQSADSTILQVINELELKLKNTPNDHKILLELAHLKMDSGLYEEAIKNYKEYLNYYPQTADVIVDIGVCYFNLQDYDKALKYFDDALAIKPKHQIAHINVGIVLLNQGKIEESRKWFKKAVEIDPNSDAGKKAQKLLTSH